MNGITVLNTGAYLVDGYLVVECRGRVKGVFEDYIDLAYILELLYMDAHSFLQGVEEVRISYAERGN